MIQKYPKHVWTFIERALRGKILTNEPSCISYIFAAETSNFGRNITLQMHRTLFSPSKCFGESAVSLFM